MHLHAAEFMAIALDARDRAAEARRSDRTVMAADALVSVVMAAAATEAFINELGAYYELGDLAREPGRPPAVWRLPRWRGAEGRRS
jgi:hypothetical protein